MRLAVYALAVWRLSHMVVKEAGPFDAFDRLHDLPLPSWVAAGLHCVSCTSVWAALLLLAFERTPLHWLNTVLAGSAIAKLLEDYLYEPEVGEANSPVEESPFSRAGWLP